MAVVPRKRSGGIVYGVLTSWSGGKHWELVGKNKREAEAVDARRKREVETGTFRPGELTDAASVKTFAERWLEKRSNRSADNDRALVRRHVLGAPWFASMRLGDVRPRHVLRLIDELNAGKLAPKSVALVMGLVRVMLRDAVIADVLLATPYVVPRGLLTRAGEKRSPYTAAEASDLMAEPVGERERVWNTIAFYTGARCGEVCGLRWGDWDEAPLPLGALSISRQYGGQVLKTERPRVVPVHPELARVLAAWRERWSLHYLHRPGSDDFIVPRAVLANGDVDHLTKSAAYKAWIRSCTASGVTNRSVHSTRHTFITLARRGGADKEHVELVTHNPKGTIVDVYTTRDWTELCRAVLSVSFDVHRTAQRLPGSGSNSGGSELPRLVEVSGIGADSLPSPYFESRLWSQETSGADDRRQPARLPTDIGRILPAVAAELVAGGLTPGRRALKVIRRKGAKRDAG